MRIASLLLIPVLVLFVIACGGDDDDSDATATPPSATGGAPTGSTGAPSGDDDVPATEAPATEAPSGEASPTPSSPGSSEPFSFPANPDPATGIATLAGVRVGAHPDGDGFDRIVFEFGGDRPAGTVEYVDNATRCGSGEPYDDDDDDDDDNDDDDDGLLRVHFDNAQAHNDQGQSTIDENEVDGPDNSIEEAESICDFEGIVEWVIETEDDALPFQVYLLEGPSRVVIDVEWP